MTEQDTTPEEIVEEFNMTEFYDPEDSDDDLTVMFMLQELIEIHTRDFLQQVYILWRNEE